MKAKDVMVATSSDQGVITIEGFGTDTVCVLGATAPTSSTGDTVSSFTIAIKKGQEAIVALWAHSNRWKENQNYGNDFGFFLSIVWPEHASKPSIDLEKLWMPKDLERLGQIVGKSIEISIGEMRYTNSEYGRKKEGYQWVPDGNLLCRYLLGEIGPEDVKAVASQHNAENSRRSREELETELKSVMDSKNNLSDQLRLINAAYLKEREESQINLQKFRGFYALASTLRWERWPFSRKASIANRIERILSETQSS